MSKKKTKKQKETNIERQTNNKDTPHHTSAGALLYSRPEGEEEGRKLPVKYIF